LFDIPEEVLAGIADAGFFRFVADFLPENATSIDLEGGVAQAAFSGLVT
jgi:hypothetical protein